MKNLESWNRERWEQHRLAHTVLDAHKTEFECPRCKEALWLKDPHLIFGGVADTAGDPLTRDVYCPKCSWIGVQLL